MQSTLKKFGNSSGMIIPKPLLTEIGAVLGDRFDLRIVDGDLVVKRLAGGNPREGWAEAAAAIAAAGDDEFVWADFVEDQDEEWTW